MKKLAVAFTCALGLGAVSLGAASADPLYCGAQGCLGVNDAGYIVVADGDPANSDPLDGYIGVTSGGSIDCDSEGGPYTTGTPQDAGCNP